jgi:hypothetical protein
MSAFENLNNPIKIVPVSGTLTKKNLSVSAKIAQENCDIRIGNWKVAVKDLTFISTGLDASFSEFANIGCN